jgi:acyl dehydratase
MKIHSGVEIAFEPFPAITIDQLRAYAEASGDPNPIHLDEQVARQAGLPGIIAHGMLSGAFIAERAQRWVGETGQRFRIVRIRLRFKAMTLLGDSISVGGVIEEAAGPTVSLALQARNQRNETVTAGWVELEEGE